MPSGPGLPFYALASWLLTELIGAIMVRSWFASGGVAGCAAAAGRAGCHVPAGTGRTRRAEPGRALCWICFVLSGATALAWLGLAFMAPAIGLGISTVTIWTPYPVTRRARA